MTTYYVATLALYVLVDAENEEQARDLGRAALFDLYTAARPRSCDEIRIRVVRTATDDEIGFRCWHQRKVADERVSARRFDGTLGQFP